jgi:catechol 2,3-dioxygenase-like lactoylglutathione lyase family enzyme
VRGARLHITGLRAPRGPGIELLEYLAPDGGRPFPPDTRPNDLWHGRATLLVADPAALHEVTNSTGVPDSVLGLQGAALVRDPDGHVLEVGSP